MSLLLNMAYISQLLAYLDLKIVKIGENDALEQGVS